MTRLERGSSVRLRNRVLDFLVLWLLALLLATPRPARAAEALDEIPDSLTPWIPWVRAELEDAACASLQGHRFCTWPSVAELDVEERGGKFRLTVWADKEGYRTIVGDAGSWPQDVRIDGRAAPVVEKEALPSVLLEPGQHVIEGTFPWSAAPETLTVGRDVALVQLEAFGKVVPLVKREEGKVWIRSLGAGAEDIAEPEQVEITTFRRIKDGTPVEIETRLVFNISGRPRELTLEQPLTTGTLPLGFSSDLASALDPKGNLRVQLIPGRHELTLRARQLEAGAPIENRPRAAPWPAQEVWTFAPDPDLRSVELLGLSSVDASRTDLPPDWREGGAYLAGPDAGLTLRTTRRGQEQVPDNRIRLARELWLDESAGGFTVVDHLRGEMHHAWRLDLLQGTLGSAKLSGTPQVLTKSDGASGVEVRDTSLDLVAVSRLKRSPQVPAVGWSEEVESLTGRLHLPPGFTLLYTGGVDRASPTWISRWDLFDVFHLLIVALAAWRLAGVPAGLLAGVALLLARGESGAPEYFWLPLLALCAVASRLGPGRVRGTIRLVFRGLLVLAAVVLLAFSVEQVREALFPHLRHGPPRAGDFPAALQLEEEAKEAPESPLEMDVEPESMSEKRLAPGRTLSKSLPSTVAKRQASAGRYGISGPRAAEQKQFEADAIVQTGPGIPQNPGEVVQLSWSGPVAKDHRIRLVLLSPNLSRLVTGVRLLTLWGLIWLCLRLGRGDSPPAPQRRLGGAATLAVALSLFCLPSPAHAEQPSDERLEQLRERLSRPPTCSPDCLTVAKLSVTMEERLRLNATVHAGARVVYRLPGPLSMLKEASLRLNGERAVAARLGEDGHLWLRLEPGVWEVEIEGEPLRDRFTLDLGDRPKHVEVDSTTWEFSGVDPRGLVTDGTLTFQRVVKRSPTPEKEAAESSQISVPPFFHVERRIILGVSSRVTTTITRSSDASTPEILRLPLLPGEQPTSAEIEVDGGVAQISFPRETTRRQVTSTLQVPPPPGSVELDLVAPPQTERTETWLVDCGVIFHCQATGLPASGQTQEGRALLSYRPFPGEALKLIASRPAVALGSTTTIHQATLSRSPGLRSSQTTLELEIESSRPASHILQIPASAKLARVQVDGERQSVQAVDGNLTISLPPGSSRVEVEWRDQDGIKALLKTPKVNVGAEGVNFRTIIELPESRWLLLAGGPAQGPALLFWGYLLLIALAAVSLPRLPFSPLSSSQWLLLGLGLTQIPSPVALFIAGWFFAIGSRPSWPRLSPFRHNLLQVALVGYSLLFLLALAASVYGGLVSSPDMEIRGAGSHAGHLVWYQDRSTGEMPRAWTLSVSLWVWRAFMLFWALWLARALLTWLRWGWETITDRGFWKQKPKQTPATPPSRDAGGGAKEPAEQEKAPPPGPPGEDR